MLGPILLKLAQGGPSADRDRLRALEVARNMLASSDLLAITTAMRDARAGAEGKDEGKYEPAQMAKLVEALMKLKTPDESGADIFPGRRHKVPVSTLYWMTFMMSPGVSWLAFRCSIVVGGLVLVLAVVDCCCCCCCDLCGRLALRSTSLAV